MNREDELHELLDELERIPSKLDDLSSRFDQRVRRDQRRKYIAYPLGLVASLFLMFGILVNCVPTFALACSKVPILKDLAEYVSFSSSLSSAVDHDYVQEINQEETKDGITASIKYVIVDQKQVNVFYTLSSSVYDDLVGDTSVYTEDRSPLNNYTLLSAYNEEGNDEYRMFKINFADDADVPNQMIVNIEVRNHENRKRLYNEDKTVEDDAVEDDRVEDHRVEDHTVKRVITEFDFLLEFDPNYTAQGDIILIDKDFEIEEQRLILKQAEIYPTHIRLHIEDDINNTAWLDRYNFYMKDDKGNIYQSGSGGLSSTGSKHSMKTLYLESSYFNQSKSLKLYIEGTQLLDKGKEKMKLDLANVKAEELPEGVVFEKVERSGEDWILTFSAKQFDMNTFYQLWSFQYYDEMGLEYSLNGYSKVNPGEEKGDRFYTEIILEDYIYDTVILQPIFTRIVELEQPIEIDIK